MTAAGTGAGPLLVLTCVVLLPCFRPLLHTPTPSHTGTPFEGGLFRMKLVLPQDFPSSPPKGFFTTKIWHPNVSKSGEICVNVLKRDWKPDLGLRHVLLVIRCLLIEPYPESALNEEAGKALLEDYAGKSNLGSYGLRTCAADGHTGCGQKADCMCWCAGVAGWVSGVESSGALRALVLGLTGLTGDTNWRA